MSATRVDRSRAVPPGPPSRRRRWPRRLLAVLAGALAVAVIGFAVLLAVTPSAGDAQERAARLAASRGDQSSGVTVPPMFAAALVATEDSRFYSDHGIDPLGALRAAASPVLGGDQGGATLDQQLAKQLYSGGRSGLLDKVEQAALAIKIDHDYSKAHILQMYATVVYFGNGYYGLPAAACGYFARPPAHLTVAQDTMLAGLMQAPTAYDPLTDYPLARARQRHVLDRLVATHVLTQSQADAVYARPLDLRPKASPAAPGCGG